MLSRKERRKIAFLVLTILENNYLCFQFPNVISIKYQAPVAIFAAVVICQGWGIERN